jgi:hypothetical protein
MDFKPSRAESSTEPQRRKRSSSGSGIPRKLETTWMGTGET